MGICRSLALLASLACSAATAESVAPQGPGVFAVAGTMCIYDPFDHAGRPSST